MDISNNCIINICNECNKEIYRSISIHRDGYNRPMKMGIAVLVVFGAILAIPTHQPVQAGRFQDGQSEAEQDFNRSNGQDNDSGCSSENGVDYVNSVEALAMRQSGDICGRYSIVQVVCVSSISELCQITQTDKALTV